MSIFFLKFKISLQGLKEKSNLKNIRSTTQLYPLPHCGLSPLHSLETNSFCPVYPFRLYHILGFPYNSQKETKFITTTDPITQTPHQ